MRCSTTFVENVLDQNTSTDLYEYLLDNIVWEDGIRSRKGFTRKAKSLGGGDNWTIDNAIDKSLKMITQQQYIIMGIYLNYYENGEMYTPNHSHKGTHQLVISLGAPRTLKVGKKNYLMSNGDGIIFGSSTHGVPKEPNVTTGRISIATFMIPIEKMIHAPVAVPGLLVETDEEMALRIQLLEYKKF